MRKLTALFLPALFALAACGGQPQQADQQGTAAQGKAPLVLAASSMQEAMTAAADAWAKQGHPKPTISFAATSALARQITSGVQADMYVAADEQWMDTVEKAGKTEDGTRRDLVDNALVLVAPKGGPDQVALTKDGIMKALGDSRIAMANPDAVPAGKYGKAAFQHLNLWSDLQDKVAQGENVRAALALVERGAAPLGVVYATDAKASDKVRVVATFPADSHPAIVYPVALLKGAGPEAKAFEQFLASDAGQQVFAQYGFVPAAK